MKKSILTLFVFVGILSFSSVEAQESPQIVNRSTTIQRVDGKDYFFHNVLQGQTLFSIARAYGVTVSDIEKANPDLVAHGLRYNQMIRIPVLRDIQQSVSYQQKQQQVTYIEHQVRRRETLYGISRIYNVSMEDILEHNPDARTGLRVNMMLQIPQIEEKIQSYILYRVLPQQTLFSLSREFGVSIDDLEKLNPELRDGLKAGQEIKIPVEGEQVLPPFIADPDMRDDYRPAYDPSTADPYCHNPSLKNSYNVALLIPLYLEKFEELEDLNTITARHPSFEFIRYYEGMLLAVDSIRKMGGDITLHVFDVCDSLPKARAVLRSPELSRMDLIIGPFHPNTLELTGEFAKARNIPVISPLYNLDNRLLLKYPNMYQAMPTYNAQLDELANFVARQFSDKNLIVVHNNQPAIINLVRGFKNSLNREINMRQYYQDSVNLAKIDGYFLNGVYVGERITNVYVLNDSLLDARHHGMKNQVTAYHEYLVRDNLKEVIYSHDGIDRLIHVMEPDRGNVLISLMGGQPVISNYTRQLHQLRDTFDITIIGTPQWATYETLDLRYLQNLNVHIFTPDFVDYDQKHNNDFIRRYRNEFHSEPDARLAFRAVQTGMYFFTALLQYGNEFHRCTEFINNTRNPNTPFQFQRANQNNNSGWENSYVYIYKYENFRLKPVRYQPNEMAVRP